MKCRRKVTHCLFSKSVFQAALNKDALVFGTPNSKKCLVPMNIYQHFGALDTGPTCPYDKDGTECSRALYIKLVKYRLHTVRSRSYTHHYTSAISSPFI